MSVQKLIASLCYIVCVLPTLNKTYLIWFEFIWSDKKNVSWLIATGASVFLSGGKKDI